MKKLERPIIFFDTEATGLDRQKDSIIELYMLKQYPDGHEDELHLIFEPTQPISQSATAVHGYTWEMVQGKPKLAEKAHIIKEFLAGADLCAHNISYDLALLERECYEAGVVLFEQPPNCFDTLNIYRKKYPNTLSHIYARMTGQKLENAHSAKPDVLACKVVFESLTTSMSSEEALEMSSSRSADPHGKFYYNNNQQLCFAFGKHKSRAVEEELEYCDWVLGEKSNFLPTTKKILSDYLAQSSK